jgi:hypothetical protein
LGEFVPRSLNGSSDEARQGQKGPKQAYLCSDCKRTPVSRHGNVCRKCLRKATYVADEQHGLLETPYRGRNWAANLRSKDELNGEDHVRNRDRGRWHRPEFPANKPWNWNYLPDTAKTVSQETVLGIAHQVWNPLIEHQTTPATCPVCHGKTLANEPATLCLACLNASDVPCLTSMAPPIPWIFVSAKSRERMERLRASLKEKNRDLESIPAYPKRELGLLSDELSWHPRQKDWVTQWKAGDRDLHSLAQYSQLFEDRQQLLRELSEVEHQTEAPARRRILAKRITPGLSVEQQIVGLYFDYILDNKTPPPAPEIAKQIGCSPASAYRVIARCEEARTEAAWRRRQ